MLLVHHSKCTGYRSIQTKETGLKFSMVKLVEALQEITFNS
jgi:hypothetical protein